jgi:hypothetical protein
MGEAYARAPGIGIHAVLEELDHDLTELTLLLVDHPRVEGELEVLGIDVVADLELSGVGRQYRGPRTIRVAGRAAGPDHHPFGRTGCHR